MTKLDMALRDIQNINHWHYEMLKSVLTEAMSEPRAEWCLCSEQLPEPTRDVLICLRSGVVTIAHTFKNRWYENNTPWDWDKYGDEVVAWMPLPKPIKHESGER